MDEPPRSGQGWKYWALAFGMVVGVLLAGVAAEDVTSTAIYQRSSCTPEVTNGCAGYVPSSFAAGPVNGNGVLVEACAIVGAVCAYLFGRFSERARKVEERGPLGTL